MCQNSLFKISTALIASKHFKRHVWLCEMKNKNSQYADRQKVCVCLETKMTDFFIWNNPSLIGPIGTINENQEKWKSSFWERIDLKVYNKKRISANLNEALQKYSITLSKSIFLSKVLFVTCATSGCIFFATSFFSPIYFIFQCNFCRILVISCPHMQHVCSKWSQGHLI